MNKRDYLRSLSFNVGERGRFSADMLAALAAAPAGSFVETVKVAPVKRVKVAVKNNLTAVPSIPAIRDDKIMWTIADRGTNSHLTVAYSKCNDCKSGISYCECASGPVPPSGAIRVNSFAEAKSL